MHPEDQIYQVKTFINELQKVQETYFSSLVEKLNLSQNGEEWLFDYIYNTSEDEGYDDFEHYLSNFKQKYENLISQKDTIGGNSVVRFDDTHSAEPCLLVEGFNSYESELETSFPSFFDEKDQNFYNFNTTKLPPFSGDNLA